MATVATDAISATNATCTGLGDGCLRVQTRDNSDARGFVTVGLDLGEGPTWPLGTGERFWPGETVMDLCFDDGAVLHSVLFTNPKTNGWWGSVEYKAPGECEFRPLRCLDCSNSWL